MTKILLCTDLDRTLIPNGPQAESENARKLFKQLANRDEVSLVFVTGRDKSLTLEAMEHYNLPEPDFVIADVGSTIYRIDNHQWHKSKLWEHEISGDWKGKSNKELQEILKNHFDLTPQEISKQKRYKLCYYVPLTADIDNLMREITGCLKSENIQTNLIWSVDEADNTGLLDILPVSANKKHALEFLMASYHFDLQDAIYAGDSGNDISVMASPIRSVLVANATDEVKKMATQRASDNNQCDTLHIAKGELLGMNGNYSAGVLEGVIYYFPVVKNWLGIDYE